MWRYNSLANCQRRMVGFPANFFSFVESVFFKALASVVFNMCMVFLKNSCQLCPNLFNFDRYRLVYHYSYVAVYCCVHRLEWYIFLLFILPLSDCHCKRLQQSCMASIPASFDTVKSEGRQMIKHCWISTLKILKSPFKFPIFLLFDSEILQHLL